MVGAGVEAKADQKCYPHTWAFGNERVSRQNKSITSKTILMVTKENMRQYCNNKQTRLPIRLRLLSSWKITVYFQNSKSLESVNPKENPLHGLRNLQKIEKIYELT